MLDSDNAPEAPQTAVYFPNLGGFYAVGKLCSVADAGNVGMGERAWVGAEDGVQLAFPAGGRGANAPSPCKQKEQR